MIYVRECFAYDLSRSFMVLYCMLTSFSHFWIFIFVYSVRCVLTSLIHMQLSNFPSTTCWRDFVPFDFPIFLLKMNGLMDHRCVGLCLGSLFCSTDPHVGFCTNTHCFVYGSIVWNLGDLRLLLCFFPQDCCGASGSLWFHINFWIISSSSVKNVMGNLVRIPWSL